MFSTYTHIAEFCLPLWRLYWSVQ